ncbi:MAG: major facilitator superfamily domain-containing protein 7 [Candidatus Heimdallarchaeota archaeon]|nr:major facilitator superfamily domain-containing protein 7 [Candidatus Heimdallarchaeota archaeon]
MNSVETTEYKVYSYRWIVLVLFGLVALVTQMIWITFAAIEPSAAPFYGVGSNAILMLSLVFMIVYIPMNIPAAMAIDKFGLKWGTGIGVILTGIFGILRAVSDQYHWVLIFQIGCAIGQPFLLNSFTKVSTNWFPEKEKALATSLGTMFVLLGVLLGMLITPMLLIPAGDPTLVLYIYGGLALAFMVIYLIFVKDKPETPPNAYSDKTKVFETKGTWDLFKNKDFNILFIIFLFGAGAFNAVSTGIAQLYNSVKVLMPASWTLIEPDDLLGILGGIMIVGGIAGAITLSTLSDKYRKRKPFLITSAIAGAVCSLLFFFVEYFVKSFLPLYILHCIIGFFFGFLLIAALPVGLTFAAEITHPLPEETSNGWLMWIGQLGGIALIGIIFGMKTDAFNFIIYGAILVIATIFAFRMNDLDAYELK